MSSEETASVPVVETAEVLKRRGNELFATRNYDQAIELYNKAIALDPDNAVLYSNRSACYASLKQWTKALEDAKLSISKDASFIKAYHRLASAQRCSPLTLQSILGIKLCLAS